MQFLASLFLESLNNDSHMALKYHSFFVIIFREIRRYSNNSTMDKGDLPERKKECRRIARLEGLNQMFSLHVLSKPRLAVPTRKVSHNVDGMLPGGFCDPPAQLPSLFKKLT